MNKELSNRPAFARAEGDNTAATCGISALEYFAAHEPTSPPQAFMLKQFPPNPIKAKNGAPMPTSDPTAEELAAALAKWRFLCAECMLAESKKRSE